MVSDSPGAALLAYEEDGQHLSYHRDGLGRHVQFNIGGEGGGANSPPLSPPPFTVPFTMPIADETGHFTLNVLQEILDDQHRDPAATTEPPPPAAPPVPEKRTSYYSVNSANSLDSMYEKEQHRKASALTPTRVLIELYDLAMRDEALGEGFWKETARWIKYEEDVEGLDLHWGMPHVAFLSFHSMLQLRKCMTKGVILLDMEATNYEQICECIAKAMTHEGHNITNTKKIMQVLQMKHCQVPDRRMSRISTVASGFFERHTSTMRTSSSAVPIAPRRDSSEPHRSFHRQHSFQQPTILEDDEYQNSIQKGGTIPTNQRSFPNVRNAEAAAAPISHRKRGSVMQFFSNTLADFTKNNHHSKSGDIGQFGGEEILKKSEEDTELAQVLVGKLSCLSKARFVMVRLARATYLPDLMETKVPIRFLFVILGPELDDGSYHELGRSISTLMANQQFNRIAYSSRDKSQLIEGIDQFLDESVVIPPGDVASKRLLSGDEIKKALKRRKKAKAMAKVHAQAAETEYVSNGSPRGSQSSSERGRKRMFFNGMIDDLRNRFPYYWSDIKDALDFQCITSIVFMFFASFAPAITFGGLMGKYTNEKIGTIETLMAQCVCGIIWGLFAAQPLLIMSATGPVLIFEASLYTFCQGLDVDFLTVRWYSGLWIFLISLITVAVDGSRLLVYVTRFTEDIFAALISAIFIAESCSFLVKTFKENPVEDYSYYKDVHKGCSFNMTNVTETMEPLPCSDAEPNTALLTAIIMVTTFLLAYALRQLRDSFYLGRHLRRAIGDFGVLIAIALVACLVHVLLPDPYLARLDMPDHINFTNLAVRGHGLLVHPWLPQEKWWAAALALIPALLVFILLFVETEITELLLARKERGLKKGSGMHWDLVLMGGCAFLCSCLGLPWMCAAAVQSLAHCSSLTKMKKAAPGERPQVDTVIEQRVTTIGVSIMMGAFAFAGSYLRLPLASLFGVFLYLGIMNLSGVQLVNRIILFFIPEKYFPIVPYTESVRIWKIHIYTCIQIVCLVFVYAVKNFKITALAFPFVLMLFIVFRQLVLPRLFNEKELRALDGEEEDDDGEWIDRDFYENAPIPV